MCHDLNTHTSDSVLNMQLLLMQMQNANTNATVTKHANNGNNYS